MEEKQQQPQPKRMTVGLFKKDEDNRLEDYLEMPVDTMLPGFGFEIGSGFEELVFLKLEQMKSNP